MRLLCYTSSIFTEYFWDLWKIVLHTPLSKWFHSALLNSHIISLTQFKPFLDVARIGIGTHCLDWIDCFSLTQTRKMHKRSERPLMKSFKEWLKITQRLKVRPQLVRCDLEYWHPRGKNKTLTTTRDWQSILYVAVTIFVTTFLRRTIRRPISIEFSIRKLYPFLTEYVYSLHV